VVLAGVHAVGRDELAILEMEEAEAAAGHVAADHVLVRAGGQARHLQLLVVLVAPEPGCGGEGTFLAQQGCGGALGLFGGVLHGLQSDEAAIGQAARGAVAGGHDARVAGAAAGVHHDAALAFEPGGACQFVVGVHADADQHQASGIHGAVIQTHAGHAVVGVVFDGGDLCAQHQLHAVAAVQFGVPI